MPRKTPRDIVEELTREVMDRLGKVPEDHPILTKSIKERITWTLKHVTAYSMNLAAELNKGPRGRRELGSREVGLGGTITSAGRRPRGRRAGAGGGGNMWAGRYTPMAPNCSSDVEAVHRENPGLIYQDPMEFTRLVAQRLHAKDSNWGLNGKRGDPNNLSRDAIAYRNLSMPLESGQVEIFDIIVSVDSPDSRPGWLDVTGQGGAAGAWVDPG